MPQISLDLAQSIYDSISQAANEKGITIEEEIRYSLGQNYRMYSSIPPVSVSRVMPVPKSPLNNFAKLALDSLVNEGLFKCPNCTLPLSKEDIDKGVCSKCGSEI